MAFFDLQRILMEMLPSPAMVEQAEVLRIQPQLEEVRRPLWAINAVIWDAHLRVMALKEQALDDWMAEVGATLVDLEDLLVSIIDRQEREVQSDRNLSRSSAFLFPAVGLAFRIKILRKLKKMGRRLNGLVERGSTFNLHREPMDSMDPLQDGYSTILEDEVKGLRRVEYEQIMEQLQQQQRQVREEEEEMHSTANDEEYSSVDEIAKEEQLQQQQRDLQEEVSMHSTTKDEEYSGVDDEIAEMGVAPFTIVIEGEEGTGKRTLARMIYHDEWVGQHFHHRLWVDASNFYYEDVEGIGREIGRCMGRCGNQNYIEEIPYQTNNNNFQDMWLLTNQRLAGRRYLLILDGFNLLQEANNRWKALKRVKKLNKLNRTDNMWEIMRTLIRLDATKYRREPSNWANKWNELNSILLRVGGPGSTIIITTTTTTTTIDEPMEYELNREYLFFLRLGGISKNDWKDIFMRWALAHQRPHQDKRMYKQEEEDMARTITTQLYTDNLRSKNPLSAKVLGSIFRYIEISRWRSKFRYIKISRRQEIWDDLSAEISYNENLSILYFHPTRNAKKLLYLSFFSDDDIFPSEEFMHMMIAEGILPLWNDKDMRLEYMSMRGHESLTQDVETQYCFTINLGNNSPMIPKQCRHLCLLFSSNASTTSFPTLAQFKRSKLRTLILRYSKEDIILKDPKRQIPVIPKVIFATLTYLRTLYLRASRVQHLLYMIGRLHNLRYLNLSYTEIVTLSKSLCNLQNLQILNLAHCQNLEKLSRQIHKLGRLQILKLAYCEKLQMLPTTITNLINLQELDLEGCPWLVQLPQGVSNLKRLVELNMHNCISLTQMPHGIGELTNLLRLSGYHANDKFGSALEELQNLINLKELRIENLEQAWRSDEIVGFLGLQKKTNLRYLTLCWQWWNMDDLKLSKSNMAIDSNVEVYLETSIEQYVEQLEDLQPYRPRLKMLEIISYAGNKWPSWMLDVSAFESLREIRLINLNMCERIPPLGQLDNLRTIEISGMNLINIVDDFICGRSGKKLTFSEMPRLEKLSIRYNVFEELKFIQCPKLMAIVFNDDSFLGNMMLRTKLKLWLNNEMMFTSEFQGWDLLLSGREGMDLHPRVGELEIVGCQELKYLPQDMKNIQKALMRLTIISCNNLISLPDWTGKLAFEMLTHLEICNCPMLKSIPPIKDIILLEQITIEGCPKLQLLDMSSFKQRDMNDNSLQVTIQGCPKLQIIPRDMPLYIHLRIIK